MQRSSLSLRVLTFAAIIAALFSASQIALAGPFFATTSDSLPTVVGYQGSVKVNGSPYSATAYFKFAIVNAAGNETYWSNDGTSVAGGQPIAAVPLAVSSGLFNVLLGDTSLSGMTKSLTPAVFRNRDCYMRVWFSQSGNSGTFSWLSPDRRIASVPFALNADSLDGLDAVELAPLNRPAPPQANTLTVLDSAGTVGQYTSITIGTDGLAIIAYYDVTNGDLKVAHCNDTACSSATTVVLDGSSNDVGKYTSLAIGADSLPVISYYDATAGDLKVAHCGSVDCATGNTLTVLASTNDVGQYSSLAIGSDGLPVISYYDATNDDLKVAHCGSLDCSSSNSLATPDTASGQHTAIAVGVDGLPIISYSLPSEDKVKSLHCGNIFCSSGNQSYFNGYTYGVAYTSISVASDGFPIISYAATSSTNRYLISVHCIDLICSSAQGQTAVGSASSSLYQYSSISVGADGIPVLSNYDPANGNLNVGHCNKAMPCSSWTISVVDSSANDVGHYNSITIGADGLPIISYYDATAGDLKVAHCSNPFCSAYFRLR